MKTLTKKSIAAGVVIATLLSTTSLFAYGKNCDDSKCDMKQSKMCDSKKSNKRHGDNSKFLMGLLNTLDLTADQQSKIDALTQEFQKQRTQIFEAFSADGFDKQKYIDAHMNKRENMVKAQADFIEKVYAVLTDAQKKEVSEELKDFNNLRKSKVCRN